MTQTSTPARSVNADGTVNINPADYTLPSVGGNPGNEPTATTPGSFANPAQILPGLRGAKTFSSPDTPAVRFRRVRLVRGSESVCTARRTGRSRS